MTPNLNQAVPDTTDLLMTSSAMGQHQIFRLSHYLGKTVILYFYPKDSTPGCTNESMEFRDQYTEFLHEKAIILGVSRDSLKSHDKFKTNLELPFELISDTEELLCQQFNVIKEKNMYGKKVRGIERSTFLIDANGLLRQEWRKVKVNGHATEVLAAVRALKS